jgi:CRP-like cAMP-binding protein
MDLWVVSEEFVLFNKGDPSDAFYIILKGAVEAFNFNMDGSERMVNRFGVGRAFGERGLIKQAPRSLSVRTLLP